VQFEGNPQITTVAVLAFVTVAQTTLASEVIKISVDALQKENATTSTLQVVVVEVVVTNLWISDGARAYDVDIRGPNNEPIKIVAILTLLELETVDYALNSAIYRLYHGRYKQIESQNIYGACKTYKLPPLYTTHATSLIDSTYLRVKVAKHWSEPGPSPSETYYYHMKAAFTDIRNAENVAKSTFSKQPNTSIIGTVVIPTDCKGMVLSPIPTNTNEKPVASLFSEEIQTCADNLVSRGFSNALAATHWLLCINDEPKVLDSKPNKPEQEKQQQVARQSKMTFTEISRDIRCAFMTLVDCIADGLITLATASITLQKSYPSTMSFVFGAVVAIVIGVLTFVLFFRQPVQFIEDEQHIQEITDLHLQSDQQEDSEKKLPIGGESNGY